MRKGNKEVILIHLIMFGIIGICHIVHFNRNAIERNEVDTNGKL